mmetsp:Transcript_76412/g.105722  ORF Transcript_76412/g.105722 Transcript_76412/m.105722 type:complete len:246 (-) Transcript_76412:116-853(-)
MFSVESQVRGSSLLRECLLIKGLSHITEIPDSEFSGRSSVESSGKDRLVTLKPNKFLRFGSSMTGSDHSSFLNSGIKHKHVGTSGVHSKHLTITGPSERGRDLLEPVVRESHSVFLLLDIPKLDSEVTRGSSNSVFDNRMPSGVENLFTVTLKLGISFRDVLRNTILVNNPKLASSIIRCGGKKLIVERRELKIIDTTLVTVAKRDSHIKLLESIIFKASKRTCTIPANSSELSIAHNAIGIVFA